MKVKIRLRNELTVCDPISKGVVILGQHSHLKSVPWDVIKVKLQPRVDRTLYEQALASVTSSSGDVCPLFLQSAVLASLPTKCSRHNAPSQCHAVTKILKAATMCEELDVVIVCERSAVFASACAVARAYPLFTRKNRHLRGEDEPFVRVDVEFIVVNKGNGRDDQQTRLTEADLLCLEEAIAGVQLAARIVDTPCSEMHTIMFLGEIEDVALQLGAKLTVFKGEEVLAEGFGGIFHVGKAAERPPILAVLSHTPPNARSTIAWVGKGIVYDTGGLCIKSKTNMPGMKRDCGGAAAVLGAFRMAVKTGFKENLHAVFCLAENSVSSKATRPDDIITMYSGRTVEVNNTDAEGRLVLADGVVYADRILKADIIVDVATLTGAQGVATGKYHGALVTNNEDWEGIAVKAGRMSGDLIHPLPYSPELHFPEFASAIADMKNSVADRNNAQPSCAGLFIQAHLGFDSPKTWLHIDMAYPSASGERATGYGVSLLAVMFGHYLQSDLVNSISPSLCENGPQNSSDGTHFKKIKLG